jgi:predicted GTPase
LLRFQGEKGKKRGRNKGKNRAAPTQHDWRKMKRKKTRRKQQDCDVAKVIDTVEQVVSTAKKVYRAVEPIVKTIVALRRKTK